MKKKTKEEVIERFRAIHGDQYDYSFVEYSGMNTPVDVYCPKHRIHFFPRPANHINNATGCPECYLEKSSEEKRTTVGDYIKKARLIHGDKYDYSKVKQFKNSQEKIDIICPIHGIFAQPAYSHLDGKGCNECGHIATANELRGKERIFDISINAKKFVEKMKINDIKYEFIDIEKYTHSTNQMDFRCKKHGIFQMSPVNILRGCRCPGCNAEGKSKQEDMIYKQFKDQYIIRNTKKIISPFEIDLFFPENKVGVEVNGLYWHSDARNIRKVNYHLDKTEMAEKLGIQLLHFWDTEIVKKPKIVFSVIKSKLGLIENRIFARKCEIKDVSNSESKEFLDDNHMQGGSYIGSVRFGLYFDNKLVSIMTFGKSRYNTNYEWELIRFCNKIDCNVVGGASKLFKHATRNGIKSVISYANLRWSNGNLYEKLGFTFINRSKPNYFYTNGNEMISRIVAQKHKLKDLIGDIFDENKSENENMNNFGYYKIYDCGNLSYGYKEI